MRYLSKIYAVCLVLMAGWLGMQFVHHAPVQTQLTALLPHDTSRNPVFQAANRAQEQQLNQQIVLLVGASEADKAFQAAAQVAQTWQDSGYFSQVDGKIEPDLAALRQSLQTLGVATLPAEQVRQLREQPQQYFVERAESAVNPFSGSLLSLEEDWLGLGRFVFAQSMQNGLSWHSEYGMLYTERDGKTWVWLRAHLPNTTPHPELLSLLQASKQTAQAEGYALLATGGALFAADAKQSAERESGWMSAVGLTLTFGLLLAVFRSWRVLALMVPLGVGVLVGVTAAVLVFGEIHALTLVVGTSLVGVLVDFPLHWLASSLFHFRQPESWNGVNVMQRVLPSFVVSLLITLSGYILLWFTPLPVLQQTAVFSAAALLGAFAATVWFLPPLFRYYQPRQTGFTVWMMGLAHLISGRKMSWILAILLTLLSIGVMRSQWQDDIRHWMTMRPDLLADSQQIAQISGMGAGQTVLITARSEDELLKQNQLLERAIGEQAHIQSLNQWLLTKHEQILLKQQLAKLAHQPEIYAPLLDLGVPSETIQAALKAAADAPTVSLADSLTAPQAEAFRALYLGEVNGQWASLARLYDVRADFRLPESENWQLLDKRSQLNQQFIETRNLAAWLKLLSFAVAWAGLWWWFGWRRGSLMLAVPMVAVIGTLGVLGWLGLSVSLFAMFGLLLAAAIGVDYAVYALTAPETAAARVAGITLAAITTCISFILLAFSTTSAVAIFGVSVSVGVALSWVMAICLAARHQISKH